MTKKRVRVGRITKPCEVCGAGVERQASQFRDHVFCSKACYWKSGYRSSVVAAANSRRSPVSAIIEKPCETCGKPIQRSRSQYRNRAFCSPRCKQEYRVSNSARQITAGGYVKVFVGRGFPGADAKGHILEHRKVMQERIGRALLPKENVHHRNGIKDDNSDENLELWTTSQPSGQRVEEKLAWARAFIAEYEDVPLT